MGRRPILSREQVLKAAREAFAERGFEGTTLASIGARAGVSPAALLRHASTKEALFAAAMTEVPKEEAFPFEILSEADGSEDPRPLLRRAAQALVPYIETKLGENIARWMRARTDEEARTLRLPFDPRSPASPPARGLMILTHYFEKAGRAGTIRVRDPRAAALAFAASVHSYVFLHRVVRMADPPIPLDRYLDTLFDIWTRGALRSPSAARRRRPCPPAQAGRCAQTRTSPPRRFRSPRGRT